MRDLLEKIGLTPNEAKVYLFLIDYGESKAGRIAKETGIQKPFIADLVNLADMSRLPYSNRKTVKHLFAGGYDSVAKIVQTDSEKMIEDMKSYFNRIGVKVSGFIDLKGIAQWVKNMPIVVKDG